MKNQLSIVFGVQGTVSVESIYDQIPNQWIVYHNKNSPATFYIKDEDEVAIRRKGQGIAIFIGHVLQKSVVYISQRGISVIISQLMITGLQKIKSETTIVPESILSYFYWGSLFLAMGIVLQREVSQQQRGSDFGIRIKQSNSCALSNMNYLLQVLSWRLILNQLNKRRTCQLCHQFKTRESPWISSKREKTKVLSDATNVKKKRLCETIATDIIHCQMSIKHPMKL